MEQRRKVEVMALIGVADPRRNLVGIDRTGRRRTAADPVSVAGVARLQPAAARPASITADTWQAIAID